ncbi:MAG TPA: pyruvate, water dikinase regulatory protein [Tepidisphaeraceae bacterium]
MSEPTSRAGRSLPVPLYILSDSTGNLPRHMVAAFLTQFPPGTFDVRMETFLQNAARVADALEKIATEPGIVFHAVISPEQKEVIAAFCAERDIAARDITGGFVDFLAEHSGVAPSPDAKNLHSTGEAYQARIRAMEFTLEHDDGLGLGTIGEADIVLTGISRTSKTPTSIYLAQQGYRTANVALAMEVAPPAELLKLPGSKVVGLIIDPLMLVNIRTNRQTGWRMGMSSYNDPNHVMEEIDWSRRLFRKQGWPVLDVTGTAIEETAAKIVGLLGLGAAV